jgi:hypothetical protein
MRPPNNRLELTRVAMARMEAPSQLKRVFCGPSQEHAVVRFHANTVVVDDSDKELILVGFADDMCGRYRDALMVQRSYEFDEQDVGPGMDRVYIERNEQSRGGYGGIRQFDLYRDRVSVALDDTMGKRLGGDLFEITFQVDEDRFSSLRSGLAAVFRGCECYRER